MIMGITGPIASGKSVLVEMLIEKGFTYIRLSDEVREEAKNLGIPIERIQLQNLGNAMRAQHGDGYWAERVLKKMQIGKNYVIDGIRNPGEIARFKAAGNFFLAGVSAPIERRLQWIIARNKDSDPKSIEQIKAIDARDRGVGEAEYGQQTDKCFNMADRIIMNEGTLDELKKKAGEFLEDLKC